MELEKNQENQSENMAPVAEESVTIQTKRQTKKDSSQLWLSFTFILRHLLFVILIIGGIYWLFERHEYRAEHIIASSDGDPVQIYYTTTSNAAKVAANYLAYAMEQTLGLESEFVTEQDKSFRGISILCGTEVQEEPEQKATIVFAAAAMPANSAEGELEDAAYFLRLRDDSVSILIPEWENCFGAVKAIADRWLQADCGVTGDGELVISRAMIDGLLTGLPTEITGQLRIMTQNLRNHNDGEGKTVEDRAARFFQLVEEYQPDLIGTQEATWKWMQLLEKGLSDQYELFGCSRLGPNTQDGEWNTILYRKARFTIIDSDTFWLSNTPSEVKSKLNYDGAIRICTWVLLKDTETDKTLLFSNTHLQNTINKSEVYREVRKRQVEILLQKLRGNGNMITNYPGFMTGDFNGDPSEPFYSLVTEVYEDSRFSAVQNSSSVDYTYQNYGKKQRLLDYCFHSPKNTTILDYHILDDRYDGYVSDHYGILITAVVN